MAKKKSKHGGAGKSDGNQFHAFRVERGLWLAFLKAAKMSGHEPNDLLRQLMADAAVWS